MDASLPTYLEATKDLKVSESPEFKEEDVKNFRRCMFSGATSEAADLGVMLYVEQQHRSSNIRLVFDSKKYPLSSRIEFNKGIQSKTNGDRNYVVRTEEGVVASHWLPLVLNINEHWVRTLGAGGTKKVARKEKKKSPRNVYFLSDRSGSMAGAKLTQSLASVKDFIASSLTDSDFVSFTQFNNVCPIPSPPISVKNKETWKKIIDSGTTADGCTHLWSSISRICEFMDTSKECVFVVCTDGDDNDPDIKAFSKAKNDLLRFGLNGLGITFIIITVGVLSLATMAQLIDLSSVVPKEKREIIQCGNDAKGIKEAYTKASKLIISKSGAQDSDVVGTSDLLESAISLIVSGENGNFTEDAIWKTFTNILCQCVLKFIGGDALNETSISLFTDIHRTAIELFNERKTLKDSVLETVSSFMDLNCANNRRRDLVPNLGEFVLTLSLVDELKWEEFRVPFVQEVLRRNSKFHRIDKYEEFIAKSTEEQLKSFFSNQRTSMLLIAFNVHFALNAVRKEGRSISDCTKHYDENNLSYLSPEELTVFVNQFISIQNMKSFEEIFGFLGLTQSSEEILKLIWACRSQEAEPEVQLSGKTIQVSNRIRNVNVATGGSSGQVGASKRGKGANQTKRHISYVGWTIVLTSEQQQELKGLCGSPVKLESFSCTIFQGKENVLNGWANRYEGVSVDAELIGFVKTGEDIVGRLCLDKKEVPGATLTYKKGKANSDGKENDIYIVLSPPGTGPSATPPKTLKTLAENGQLGSPTLFSMKVNAIGTVFAR